MSREQSDEEDGVVETEDGQADDETAETEPNGRLARGSDPGPELVQKDTSIPILPGVVGAEADTPDPGPRSATTDMETVLRLGTAMPVPRSSPVPARRDWAS